MLKKILFMVLCVGTFYFNGSARDTTNYLNTYRNGINVSIGWGGYYNVSYSINYEYRTQYYNWLFISHSLRYGIASTENSAGYDCMIQLGGRRNSFITGSNFNYYFSYNKDVFSYNRYYNELLSRFYFGYQLFSKNYRFYSRIKMSNMITLKQSNYPLMRYFDLSLGYNFSFKNQTKASGKQHKIPVKFSVGYEFNFVQISENIESDFIETKVRDWNRDFTILVDYQKIRLKPKFCRVSRYSVTAIGLGYKFVSLGRFSFYPYVNIGTTRINQGLHIYDFASIEFEPALKLNEFLTLTSGVELRYYNVLYKDYYGTLNYKREDISVKLGLQFALN